MPNSILIAFLAVFPPAVFAQILNPPFVPPPAAVEQPNAANPNQRFRVPRPEAPGANDVVVIADTEESEGSLRHLRGHVHLETFDKMLEADEADYDEDTGDAEVRGNVRYENFLDGTKLQCDHGKYNVDSETGVFFDVVGTSVPRIVSRPGYLTSTNPFFFEGKWAEKLEDRYIVHDGYVTDCKVPKPWWRLTAPKFDIMPGQRAIAYRAVFRLRPIPLFYAPVYRKSLERLPRQSGFLTPNMGHSSLYGEMFGLGYYWAISRSMDTLYRIQYFTSRGFAHTLDYRAKITPGTDFGFSLYGVQDRGVEVDGERQKQGGVEFISDGRSQLGDGWEARWRIDYLTSFLFREAFSQSFQGGIWSESHSVGFLDKHWSSYAFYVVADSNTDYEQATPAQDKIETNKLPEVDFLSRERQIVGGVLPVWFSLISSGGFLNRTEPYYQTPRFVDRFDVYPSLSTAFHFAGFNLMVTGSIRETEYGDGINYATGAISTAPFVRSARELRVTLLPPALERIFNSPKWLGGDKVKHVIEPRIDYHLVGGIDDFNRIIHFDETDIMSDTNSVTLSLTNRLFVKDKNGNVNEEFSWEVAQSRYLDPTFGGAVVPGQLNVIQDSLDLDGFAFIAGPRNYSPIVSSFRFQHIVGIEWRMDYDPLLKRITNSTASMDIHFSKYFVSAGHSEVRPDPAIGSSSDQLRGTFGIGNQTRKGWNAAFSIYYDYKLGIMDFSTTEITYNTDCCGLSIEYRRFNVGIRDDTQYRIAFAISNLGSFGSLQKQDRLY